MAISKKPVYVVYLSTDGVGSNIIRSIFMHLAERNIISGIDDKAFWARSLAALKYPHETNFEEGIKNFDSFKSFCHNRGMEIDLGNITEESIYLAFDQLFSQEQLYFDFSKHFTTVFFRPYEWEKDHIAQLRTLLLGYLKRDQRKVDIKFLLQVRNPLDNIASLNERFGSFVSLDHHYQQVLSHLINVKTYKEFFEKNDSDKDFIFYRLDDLVYNFSTYMDSFSRLLHTPIELNDFYVSKLSLNKWYSDKAVFDFLDDKRLMDIAGYFGYNYFKIPRGFRSIYLVYGNIKRAFREVKLEFDFLFNRVNTFNSISTRHRHITLIGRVVSKILSFLPNNRRKHSSRYSKMLLKHSKTILLFLIAI